MLLTEKARITLEYDKIINMLADCAATEGARARALSLTPTDDFDLALSRQVRTDDAKRLINAKGYPAFSASELALPAADRAYKGAQLSTRELIDVAALFRSARALVD